MYILTILLIKVLPATSQLLNVSCVQFDFQISIFALLAELLRGAVWQKLEKLHFQTFATSAASRGTAATLIQFSFCEIPRE